MTAHRRATSRVTRDMSTRISASEAETRRRSRASLLPRIAGLAVCAYWLPGAAAVCGPLRSVFGVRNRLDAADRVLLTFDDGPHPQATPAARRSSSTAGVQATFFLVGEQVERWPQLAAEIASAGHEVALPLPSAPLPLAPDPVGCVNSILWGA